MNDAKKSYLQADGQLNFSFIHSFLVTVWGVNLFEKLGAVVSDYTGVVADKFRVD